MTEYCKCGCNKGITGNAVCSVCNLPLLLKPDSIYCKCGTEQKSDPHVSNYCMTCNCIIRTGASLPVGTPERKSPPPIGLVPRHIRENEYRINRMSEIMEACKRYYHGNMVIPDTWLHELEGLCKQHENASTTVRVDAVHAFIEDCKRFKPWDQ